MSLTSSRLRAVNAAVEAGNFSAAARRLGISQPAVAQQIRDLEAAFGITLFERRGNGLTPTSTCQALYGITTRMQAMESEALAILRRRQDFAAGELRIGLGNAMPGMRLIADFQRLYPKVRVHIEMGNWAGVMEAVLQQRVDIGMLPEVPEDGRFRRQACLHQRIVAVVHADHPLARRTSVTLAELTAWPLIFRSRGSQTRRAVDRALRQAGLSVRPMMVVDSREGVLEAVANEIGIGFMWEHGSSRVAPIARLAIDSMDAGAMEYIFSLSGTEAGLADLFFQAHPALTPKRAGSATSGAASI